MKTNCENKILSIEDINKLNNREISERYIKCHYPVFYDYLTEKYGDLKYDEKIYLYRNNLKKTDKGHCKLCGKPTKFINKTIGYATYCSAKCSNSDKEKIEKQKQTTLLHYGVENPSQHKTIKEKKKQTCASHFEGGYASEEIKKKTKQICLERYGDENYRNIEKQQITKLKKYGNKTFTNREKAAQTTLNKYGYKSPFGCKEFIEKSKQTKLEKYGDKYYVNLERAKRTKFERYGDEYFSNRKKYINTCLERYGVTNTFSINKERNIEKTKQTCLARYGTYCYSKTTEYKEKTKQNNIKKYGVTHTSMLDLVKQKIKETKDKNHTHNTSSIEEQFASWLDENNISYIRQYKSEQYPFCCDFYFPEKDLYFEINGHWSHGLHPFDENNEDDKRKVGTWKQKGTEYYNNAIKTWTIADPLKVKTAKENNLNFKVFYSCNLNEVINEYER